MSGEIHKGGSEKPKNLEEVKAEHLLAALDEVTRIANEIRMVHDSTSNVRDARRMIMEQDDNNDSIKGSMADALKKLNEAFLDWQY